MGSFFSFEILVLSF